MGNYCEQVVHCRYIQLGLQPIAGQRSPGPPGGRDHPRFTRWPFGANAPKPFASAATVVGPVVTPGRHQRRRQPKANISDGRRTGPTRNTAGGKAKAMGKSQFYTQKSFLTRSRSQCDKRVLDVCMCVCFFGRLRLRQKEGVTRIRKSKRDRTVRSRAILESHLVRLV